MAEKSKILIIGGTGYIGKFIVEASANMGHPTFVLVRESTLSDPSKSSVIDCFKKAGVNIITGDLHDHERLITAIKQVDVVISAVGVSQTQLADQVKIIAAIKEAGNIKKFYPSEFGNDADRSHAVEPAKTLFATKAQVRRAIEAENIPYTYISSNCFAGYLLPTLAQSGVTAPPRDKVVSLGDGNAKAVFNEEHDIATYTIKTVDDPRTVNKSVYINPPGNIYSFNELVSLWEKKIGKTLEKGDLHDHERLITAIKQVDVVISAVGVSQTQLADQVKIIAAIKEAGNIKKFYPSEFGNDADRSHAVEPAKTLFATKAQVRRAIEAENIPYTYISSNCFAGYLLPTLAQSGVTAPPRDKVVSLGDGNAKAVFNEEHDIATYTIKTVDDPRTVNKSVYINPPGNIYSFNELVSLWEKKIGKTLEKVYLSEDQVLKNIEESPLPRSLIMSISHTVFVKGDQTNFEIEPSFGVEASELYPDVKYTTVDEYLSRFV
uniref:Putative NAD(P)-binding domain-containing protein n=1 Tax=Helianthus annuus TaxID=4232 RepID=A0A251V6Z2_HELAN